VRTDVGAPITTSFSHVSPLINGNVMHQPPRPVCPTLAGKPNRHRVGPPLTLWVPNRSSVSCDLGVFVDQSAESVAASEVKVG
jgi:hypothetical protein